MQLISWGLRLVHLAALLLFAHKYLQVDVKTSAVDSAGDAVQRLDAEIARCTTPEAPAFDRLVFVLLDAWRWNFLYAADTPMGELRRMASGPHAVPLVARARVPTVTMPSLKCIFSGAPPVFFELVSNVDESGIGGGGAQMDRDNLLSRLHRKGRKLAVYGDDVWTKLLPADVFHRADVSFGFNIMDHVECDALVDRGFAREQQHGDSDVIVLHYLGLDHIGHSFPTRRELFAAKLREMDAKVAEVYAWMEQRDAGDGKKSLLVVMGDHGMTEGGNHGGGSREETHAAAVLLSPHLRGEARDWEATVRHVERVACGQEDVAATLAALLDTGGPLRRGHGQLLEEVLDAAVSAEEKRRLLLVNVRHLLLALGSAEDVRVFTTAELLSLQTRLKTLLDARSFQFDEPMLLLAVALLIAVAVCWSVLWRGYSQVGFSQLAGAVFVATVAACQVGTSFIAEEHVIWQFFVPVLCAAAAGDIVRLQGGKRARAVLPLIGAIALIHRVLAGWNAVGTLWANGASIASLLRQSPLLERAGVAVALLWITALLARRAIGLVAKASYLAASVAILVHRAGPWPLSQPALAQLALVGIATGWIGQLRHSRRLDIAVMLLSILIHRPHNAIPIILIHAVSELVNNLEATTRLPFLRLCLMHCAYYTLGLWNSVSAVDLTLGAVFTETFSMAVAPVVLLFLCWSGPLLVFVSSSPRPHPAYVGLMRALLDASACLFAYHHRFHPLTFDFFSPKILFQAFWGVFYTVLV